MSLLFAHLFRLYKLRDFYNYLLFQQFVKFVNFFPKVVKKALRAKISSLKWESILYTNS